MNRDRFNESANATMKRCMDVLNSKGIEYALDDDRLKAFKDGGEYLERTPAQTLLAYQAKHLISIRDMVNSGRNWPMAQWHEKITDGINYFVLLMALIEESRLAEGISEEEQRYPTHVDECDELETPIFDTMQDAIKRLQQEVAHNVDYSTILNDTVEIASHASCTLSSVLNTIAAYCAEDNIYIVALDKTRASAGLPSKYTSADKLSEEVQKYIIADTTTTADLAESLKELANAQYGIATVSNVAGNVLISENHSSPWHPPEIGELINDICEKLDKTETTKIMDDAKRIAEQTPFSIPAVLASIDAALATGKSYEEVVAEVGRKAGYREKEPVETPLAEAIDDVCSQLRANRVIVANDYYKGSHPFMVGTRYWFRNAGDGDAWTFRTFVSADNGVHQTIDEGDVEEWDFISVELPKGGVVRP